MQPEIVICPIKVEKTVFWSITNQDSLRSDHHAQPGPVIPHLAARAVDPEPRRHQAGGDPNQPEASAAQDWH